MAATGRRGAISGALRWVSLVLGVLPFASSLLILERVSVGSLAAMLALVVWHGWLGVELIVRRGRPATAVSDTVLAS